MACHTPPLKKSEETRGNAITQPWSQSIPTHFKDININSLVSVELDLCVHCSLASPANILWEHIIIVFSENMYHILLSYYMFLFYNYNIVSFLQLCST